MNFQISNHIIDCFSGNDVLLDKSKITKISFLFCEHGMSITNFYLDLHSTLPVIQKNVKNLTGSNID